MQQMARQAGVPERALKLDYDGNNTLATMNNLDPKKSYVLVSNDFHLARIGLIASKLDFANFHLHTAPYQFGRYDKNPKYFWREVGGTLILWFGL